jgi:hypothetical protein
LSNLDWSTQLFFFGDTFPSFLPLRFRLPNGETRYSENCSLLDIHSAGFEGPVDPAPFPPDDNHRYIWSTTTKSWVLQIIPDSDKAKQLSETICTELEAKLYSCPLFFCDDLVEHYRDELFTYIGKIYVLVHDCKVHGKLLTLSDIPQAPSTYASTKKDHIVSQQNLLSSEFDTIKMWYEKQGLVPCNRKEDALNFWYNVATPSGWTVGTDPIIPETMALAYILPSGYKLSIRYLAPSGYYCVEPE